MPHQSISYAAPEASIMPSALSPPASAFLPLPTLTFIVSRNSDQEGASPPSRTHTGSGSDTEEGSASNLAIAPHTSLKEGGGGRGGVKNGSTKAQTHTLEWRLISSYHLPVPIKKIKPKLTSPPPLGPQGGTPP